MAGSASAQDRNTGSVLAIDVGSSSVRTFVYDADGLPIAGMGAHRHYEAATTPDGGVEFDASQLFEQIIGCIDDALKTAGDRPISVIGVDTFVTNLLGIDADGEPLTPVYMWNDTRSREYVARLDLDPGAAYDRTGTKPHVSYWPPRLLWISDTQPTIFKRAARWLSIGEWLHLKLFGVARVSTSVAAWTGMLDRRSGQWDAESLRAAGVSADQLSEISNQPFDQLIGSFRERWPRLCSARWLPAIADGYAANVGCGCLSPDQAALTMGTSGALRVLIQGAPEKVPEGLFCYRVHEDHSLLGGAVSNAGNVHTWLQKLFSMASDPFAHKAEPDGHGLTVLPFWAGERSIGWHTDAQAAILGMTLNTTAADVARASLEAVIYQLGAIDRALCESLGCTPAIIASGGMLSASPEAAQCVADVLGRDVTISAEAEATARGTAILALNLLAEAALGTVYQARPAITERYRAAMRRQQRAYDLIIGKPL